MNKETKQPATFTSLALHDKRLLYVPLLIVLVFAITFIDASVLGKLSFEASSMFNVSLVGLIINLVMIGLFLFSFRLSVETQVLTVNKFEHLLSLQERYTLVSYSMITELRSYVYSAGVVSVILGVLHAETGATISVMGFALVHAVGYFVITKALRQPEFFVDFLSEEYYLLLAKCYYNERRKNKLDEIRRTLK